LKTLPVRFTPLFFFSSPPSFHCFLVWQSTRTCKPLSSFMFSFTIPLFSLPEVPFFPFPLSFPFLAHGMLGGFHRCRVFQSSCSRLLCSRGRSTRVPPPSSFYLPFFFPPPPNGFFAWAPTLRPRLLKFFSLPSDLFFFSAPQLWNAFLTKSFALNFIFSFFFPLPPPQNLSHGHSSDTKFLVPLWPFPSPPPYRISRP